MCVTTSRFSFIAFILDIEINHSAPPELIKRSIISLKLKFSQYSSIHTNYIIPHCTTLQYNQNI